VVGENNTTTTSMDDFVGKDEMKGVPVKRTTRPTLEWKRNLSEISEVVEKARRTFAGT
jgi:hypothetical protein